MTGRLVTIDLDETAGVVEAIEEERRVAVRDILEENSFAPAGNDGEFRLAMAVDDEQVVLEVADAAGAPVGRYDVPMAPLRSTIRDYMIVCDSYRSGLSTLRPEQLEAIDMGRRGLHNDGAETLRDLLSGRIDVDRDTARRLFTLVCAMRMRA